jgi:hypothetical protein
MKNSLSRIFCAIGMTASLSACDIYHRSAPSVKCLFDPQKKEILISSLFQDKVHNIAALKTSNDIVSGVSDDGVRVVYNTKKHECYGHNAEMKEILSIKHDFHVVPHVVPKL